MGPPAGPAAPSPSIYPARRTATAPNDKPTIRITAACANGTPAAAPDTLPTAEWDDIQPAKPAPSA